ncbi:uncharacterized protein F4822DRAFT_13814 [Hypoxylon trugodes]|uniref:uncharacterized protein n=1 Tax=Hypoxylon trugodes TaxID=326681 RepID=UPI0021929478|nr:uncharacterized protein F4822DRAFT_13814 [Hypoxylon trugodes]KAI1393458.1 hypothetical protein F4822DRAFT_13814 [Hypoxylon trugodes]
MLLSDLASYAAHVSPAAYCQLFYVLAAATVLAIAATPESIQSLLTGYGARSLNANGEEGKQASNGPLVRIISWVTSVGKVPHSWFMHFYLLSLSCSAFWMLQFLYHGSALEFIVRNQAPSEKTPMSINQVILAWVLMSLQGGRRLYEYVAVMRSSSSKMWIIHWLLGMAFYFCTNISIWLEGSGKYYDGALVLGFLKCNHIGSIQSSGRRSLSIEMPSLNVILGVLIFLSSWVMQYRCHRYLARLKKYSLPEDGLFRYLVCPHYTCECVLYASLALVAAPKDQLYNRTLVCAVLFVAVNLGVTAKGTKKWYGEKFGREKVQGKWAMIPGIF